jgi:penicillin-binding protein 2
MYKRRIKIFLGIIAVVLLAMGAKLWHLQIVNGQAFRDQFAKSLQYTELLEPIRGEIRDRNDQVLARDDRQYDFCLDYRLIESLRPDADNPQAKWVRQQKRAIVEKEGYSREEAETVYHRRVEHTMALARQLAQQKGIDLDGELDKITNRIGRLRRYVNSDPLAPNMRVKEEEQSHAVIDGLDDQNVDLTDTVGASIEPSLRRWYERAGLACHILGLTGQVSQADQDKYNDDQADRLTRIRQNYLDGDIIGQGGAEQMCEEILRGHRGYRRLKRGGEVLEVVPAENGQNVKLTIDADLQDALTQEMARRGYKGSVVVVSIPDGEILAMVSVPTYDPNTFRQDFNLLRMNTVDQPLINRAIAQNYPPGSTAKPVTAAAGLACGLSSETPFTCTGMLYPEHPEWGFRCDNHNGHGTLNLIQAIQHSCNVYFYHVGEFVGPQRLEHWLHVFGYGEKPGTGLPEEKAFGVKLRQASDAMQWAIGQGSFDATPLQVASAMAAIAHGEYVSPKIVLNGGPPQVHRPLGLATGQLQAIQRGMWEVVNQPGGTGYTVFRDGATERLDVVVCGKTGTADVAKSRIDSNADGKITDEDVGVRGGNMAWFAGYAPYINPQIAFAVVVEYVPEHGSTAAGPIANKLVGLCKQHGYIGGK